MAEEQNLGPEALGEREIEKQEIKKQQELAEAERKRQQELAKAERERQEALAKAERERQEALARRKEIEARSQRDARIHDLLEQTNEHCLRAYSAQREVQEAQRLENSLEKDYPELTNAGIRTTLRYAFLVLVFPAVYVINFLLIYRPVEYLAGLAFNQGTWQVAVATALLPIVLMTFEVSISSHLHFVKKAEIRAKNIQNEAQNLKITKARKVWNFLGQLMVLVTPGMILATFLARYSGENWPPPVYEMLLSGALFVLAFVTDAVVVFGGDTALQAKAFFWFKLKQFLRQRKIRRCNAEYRQEARNAARSLDSYTRELETFNTQYPNHRIALGPFNQITRRVINEWLEYQYIPAPPSPPPPPPSPPLSPSPPPPPLPLNQDPNSQSEVNSNNHIQPPYPTASDEDMNQPESQTRSDSDNHNQPNMSSVEEVTQEEQNSEVEDNRTLLERIIRDNDGEVRL